MRQGLLPRLNRPAVPILHKDLHTPVASWNEGAQRIKGYTAEEIVGRHFSVFYPEDRVAERFPQYELEVAGRERPGRGRDVHVRAAAARAPA